MKKNNEIHWGKPIAVTVVLIMLIVSISYAVIGWINHREEEISFERLYESTGNMKNHIETHMDNDREELEMIAEVIAQYDDPGSQSLWELLDACSAIGMMSRLEILLPGDTVLTKGGKSVDVKGILSFEEEAARGAHITDRETDLTDGGYIVRHYVPVCKDGETIAMLYGVIELKSQPDKIMDFPYDGDAAVYIIDGKTGDFLIDTWHSSEGGNMWSLGERKMAPGYDHEQLKQGVTDGKNGYVVFVSETAGEYLYFYYEPMGINEWRIALSVPESVVFQNADRVRDILNIILVFEGIFFILYFIWMLRYVRHVTYEKQRKLETINYMYDVEKLLFNAHEKQENVARALGEIAYILSAERVGFWIVGRSREDTPFLWKREAGVKDQESIIQKKNIYTLLEYFEQGNSEFEARDIEELRKKLPDNEHDTMYNVIAIPVKALDGSICGILVGCNMSSGKADVTLLKTVEFSFSMFCHNLTTFNAVKEQGEKDMLTGLYNRNRYEADLSLISAHYKKSLACVYIDVNGLHELNNTKGHSAGDVMLKIVAEQICERFGTEFTYRIGGDEFLVFAPDMAKDMIVALCGQMVETLKKDNYHISVGVQWETEIPSVNALIKSAEKKMYAEKKKYYEQEVNDRRKRNRI